MNNDNPNKCASACAQMAINAAAPAPRTNKTVEDFYDTIEHAATVAAPLFNLYGWTYGLRGTKHTDLVDTITELVEEVIKQFNRGNDNAFCATGRFIVTYNGYEDERELTIALDLASASEFKESVWK